MYSELFGHGKKPSYPGQASTPLNCNLLTASLKCYDANHRDSSWNSEGFSYRRLWYVIVNNDTSWKIKKNVSITVRIFLDISRYFMIYHNGLLTKFWATLDQEFLVKVVSVMYHDTHWNANNISERWVGYLLKLSAHTKSSLPTQKCKEIKLFEKVEKHYSDITSQKCPYLS